MLKWCNSCVSDRWSVQKNSEVHCDDTDKIRWDLATNDFINWWNKLINQLMFYFTNWIFWCICLFVTKRMHFLHFFSFLFYYAGVIYLFCPILIIACTTFRSLSLFIFHWQFIYFFSLVGNTHGLWRAKCGRSCHRFLSQKFWWWYRSVCETITTNCYR